jgi:hypothetical protein
MYHYIKDSIVPNHSLWPFNTLFYHRNKELLTLLVSKHSKTANQVATPKFRPIQSNWQDKYSSASQRADHELSFALPMIKIASVEAELRVLEVALHNRHR